MISLGSAPTQVAVVSIRRDFIVARRRIPTFAKTEVPNVILFTGLADFVEVCSEHSFPS